MTRKRPDIQPCGERHERYLHCAPCNPIPVERPEKLQGPEVGTEWIYRNAYRVEKGMEPRGRDGERCTVTERSYVWAPHDPAYHGGSRRYDVKVVRFISGGSLSVDDKDLVPA